MKRQSAKAITIRSYVRCKRVYPTENTTQTIGNLKTVGLQLTKEQAIQLARVLLAVTQDWDEIDVTAYRFNKRQDDGTHLLTVTSMSKAKSDERTRRGRRDA